MTVKRSAQAIIASVCVALLAFVLLQRDEQGQSQQPGAERAGARAGLAGEPARPAASTPSARRTEPARVARVQVRPLFDPNLHIKLGETAMLRFAPRERDSAFARASRPPVSASVSDGRGPERPLDVHEDGDGNYQVPFTPYGPGEFNVVLSVDGVPAGSQRVGVIGAAGRADGVVDNVDPLSVDPRDFRARTGGQFHRR